MCDSRPGSGSSTTPCVLEEETPAEKLVTRGIPLDLAAQPPSLEPRQRVAHALKREHGRPHEELEADEHRNRVPREPEDEPLAVGHAERDRLPRLHGDAPEHLLDAELGLDPAHEIVRPNRDSARRDEDVGLEPARERGPMGVLVVRDAAQPLDRCPGGRELSLDEDAVRVVDLSWLERLARTAELAPGCEHGGPRPPRDPNLGDAGSRQSRHLRRTEAGTGLDHDLSLSQVAAGGPDARTPRNGFWHFDRVVMIDNILERDDGISSVGDDASSRDPHRLARLEAALRRASRSDPETHGQRPRGVLGAQREPVHRRAVERRQVDRGRCRFRQHAADCSFDRHRLVRKPNDALEHELLRLFDRHEISHRGAFITLISYWRNERDDRRPIPPRAAARRGRHGAGVAGARHTARPRGRAETARSGRRSPALRARGPGDRIALPSEHLPAFRLREGGRTAVHGLRASSRRHAGRPARSREAAERRRERADRGRGRGRARSCARPGPDPPRPEADEHRLRRGGPREDHRFRHRARDRRGHPHRCGHADGNRRLHVPGAGAGWTKSRPRPTSTRSGSSSTECWRGGSRSSRRAPSRSCAASSRKRRLRWPPFAGMLPPGSPRWRRARWRRIPTSGRPTEERSSSSSEAARRRRSWPEHPR